MSEVNAVMGILLALVGIGTTFLKTVKFVHEGELGIRLRFGRAQRNKDGSPKIIHPGFVLLIPWVDTLRRHHVRQQTVRLYHQQIMVQQGLIFNISAIVLFRVRNIYRALFEIENVNQSIADISMGILREVLAHKNYSEFTDMESISAELLARLKDRAEEWGVEFVQFKLTDCSPSQESAPLVNVKAGVQLKMEALREAAESMQIPLSEFPHGLAAALVGVPLVAAMTTPQVVQRENYKSGKEKPSLININLGGERREQPSDNSEAE